MWVSKDGDIRRQELLDAAFDLFYEKGYHKTSINDVIAKVGVTKGAFYYYFKSMEDVVEIIAMEEASKLMAVAHKYGEDTTLDALEKIKGLIGEAINYGMINIEKRKRLVKLMQDEENAKLAKRIQSKIYELSFPLVLKIIKQGMDEEIFKIGYAEDAAELYIHLSSIYKVTLNRLLEEVPGDFDVTNIITRKLALYQQVLETVLGLEKGQLNL